MKHTMIAFVLVMIAVPAFAQRNPYPNQCQTAAIDRYNRIIATFWGRRDSRGFCRDALHFCNMEVRRRGWYDARCVELRQRW